MDAPPEPSTDREPTWRVGEVAEQTGSTVKALHHYDEIGLLVPSGRSGSGHRHYSAADVERLRRIGLLRRLGLSLEEIARTLDDPAGQLGRVTTVHLDEVSRRLERAGRLRDRLARAATRLGAAGTRDTDELFSVIEELIMVDHALQRRVSLLVYDDIAAAHDYLVEVFGLGAGEVTRDGDGTAVHGEVHGGDGVIWLHRVSPDFGLASPRTLGAATGCTSITVDDVQRHYERAVARGAEIVHPPIDQPYGVREYSARDLEGHLWSFSSPLPD
jgi:DNA-binding transcriptional MerR regulator/uncharacterized glyoxalase superfamily protein PhnB